MPETKRYKLLLEFDGTAFFGWQFQNNVRSVQGEVERALMQLLQEEIRIHGAGRTDAGVHASAMVAHFDSDTAVSIPEMLNGLNAILAADVAIRSIEIVDDSFHSRFTASSRSYSYCITQHKESIGRAYSWLHFGSLDHEAIAACIPEILGTHDFGGLSKRTAVNGHKYCHVFHAEWIVQGQKAVFNIKANRFLYGMVRCIVGGLIQVGRGRITKERFTEILASKDPDNAPMLVPAAGLTLTEVNYSQDERKVIDAIMKQLRISLEMVEDHD
jgi:tRNA pseudouridine38-40 synthase